MIQIVYKNGKPIVYQVASNNTPAPPVNISAPFLEGTGEIGTNVICRRGVWSGFPAITYTYDFKVGGLSVQNSSSNLYIPQPIDDGKVITCEVTATNTEGSTNATTSNSITAGTAPVNTVAPTVSPSGTQSTGTLITVNVGTWTGSPTITYEYRWTRNGSPISLATNTTYTIQAADDGTTIRCEVRGTNAYGVSSFVASSNSVSAVNDVAPVNTVAPVISGNQWQGQVLSSTTGTWTGIPTPTYAYQWKRNGSNIGGATSSTYTLVAADRGTNITCDVTATNVAGSATAGSNTLAIYNTVVQESGSAAAGSWDINVLTNSTYANATTQIVRVRRSGDNAEADYGVQADGTVNWTAITSWVVAGGGTQNGFIVTVYDQSGNARNFTQSTPANQMQIISGGTLLTDTGAGSGAVARAAMRGSGTQFYEIPSSTAMFNFLHNGADGWILGVQRFGTTSDPNAGYAVCGNAATASANVGFHVGYDDRVSTPANNRSAQFIYRGVFGQLAATNLTDNVITPNQSVIINWQFDADNATAANRAINWINNGSANANNVQNLAPSTSNATFNLQWGANGNGTFLLTGGLQRLIIWNANLSSQRSAITTLTNNYYRAY